MYPIAHALAKQRRGVPHLGIWSIALQRKDAMGAAKVALSRYAVFHGMTTSGVESCNSLQDWLLPARRRKLFDGAALDELQLIADKDPSENPKLCKMARSLWRRFCGSCRHAKKARVDAGLPHQSKANIIQYKNQVAFASRIP